MQKVFLIIFMLLISLFSIPQSIELEPVIDNKLVDSYASLDLSILDANLDGIDGAEVTIINAWTDLIVLGPLTMSASRETFVNLPGGPVRIEVTHSNYTNGATVINLTRNELVEETILLTIFDNKLNLTGHPLSTVSLTLTGTHDELQTTLDQNGIGELNVPSSGEGWILATFDENQSLIHWNGESNLSLQNNGSVQVIGVHADVNETGTLRVEHHPSGFWNLFGWSGEVSVSLPRTYEGEWKIFNSENGLRIGQPLITNDIFQVNITALLNDQSAWPSPNWGGHGYLNMTSTPNVGEPFNVTWEADFNIPMDFGSSLLSNRSRGLTQQIDSLFGNNNGQLSGMELMGFSTFHQEHMWAESSHLVLFDEAPFVGQVERGNFSISQNNVIGAGYYSWSESAILTGQATFGNSRMFWFPVRGDAIEAIPITVNLPPNWEVRYSPQIELITGGQGSFTLNRSLSPTVGMWTVTIGPNQAPIANAHIQNLTGFSIPLDDDSTIVSDCSDSGISTLDNNWEFRRNGYFHGSGENDTHTFSPVNLSYYHGDTLNATLVCTDWNGAISRWWGEFYVDGQSPMASLNVSEEPIVDFPTMYYNLDDVDGFEVRAGSTVTMVANATDDSGEVVQVIWRSNKSEGWQHHDYRFEDSFNQGNDVNWLHMDVEERHNQRSLTVYSIEMELIDGAGNSNSSHWDVTILDATPPVITAEVMVDGLPIGPLNPAKLESQISINLTRSFDDIDAIENIVWAVFLDNQSIIENGTWETTQVFSLPAMSVGVHELRIFASDSSGNVREVVSNPIVEPQIAAEVSGISIDVLGEPIIGEPGTILVTLQNIGSTNSNVTICYFDQCRDSLNSGIATHESPAIITFPLEINKFESGSISVDVQWFDQATGVGGNFTMFSEILPQSQWGKDADIITGMIVITTLAYLIFRKREGGDDAPL
ncbi:MAG: hypothetical protein CMA77_04480 [Euryarchaeota archaeon]|nr:hypothetical protein [Euryarchaeota archaeon]